MAFLDYLQTARDLFYEENDPGKAEAELRPLMIRPCEIEEKRGIHELMGLILRKQRRYEEAFRLYDNLGDHYQAGYCAMLQGNLQLVQVQWTRVLNVRPNHWCVSLYGMITQQLRTYPTLFQIRNHVESDIANLIGANQYPFLENLLQFVDFMTQLNLEAPKFVGRALLNSGWLDRSGPFLLKGQRSLPNDPEIYFHLGQYSMAQKHYPEARLMLKQCLMISPSYTPATDLLRQIPEPAAS
jgi:tetratricopeptide (TPR) repeat protein